MGNEHSESNAETHQETDIREPKMYKVLLHNDDYTTMEFVVMVLEQIFRKNTAEANQVMLNVHQKGCGICGIFSYDIAETKVITVHTLAEKNEFPLKCSIEEA